MGLGKTDVRQHLQAVRGENFPGSDPADVPPVVAVGCPNYRGVVVAEVFSGEQARAVGEHDIVLCEAFFSC